MKFNNPFKGKNTMNTENTGNKNPELENELNPETPTTDTRTTIGRAIGARKR